jgi:hypothetical protein
VKDEVVDVVVHGVDVRGLSLAAAVPQVVVTEREDVLEGEGRPDAVIVA